MEYKELHERSCAGVAEWRYIWEITVLFDEESPSDGKGMVGEDREGISVTNLTDILYGAWDSTIEEKRRRKRKNG